MKVMKPALLSFSLLAFAGVHAQEARQQQPQQAQQQQAQQPQQTQQSEVLGAQEQRQTRPMQQQDQRAQLARGEVRLQDVDGMNVVDRHGKDIGNVDDVVIDLNTGRIHAVVVGGEGGFLGFGGESYAFAPEEFQRDQKDRLVLDVDKQKLEDREGFAQGQWPGLDDEYWGRVAQAQQGAVAGGTAAQPGQQAQQAQKAQPGELSLMRGDTFLGQTAQDQKGNELGEIRDAHVNLQEGRISNLIVDVRDVGEVTVPAKDMGRGTDDRIVLSIDREQLMAQAREQKEQRRGQQEARPVPQDEQLQRERQQNQPQLQQPQAK